jgi:hypothetical protein
MYLAEQNSVEREGRQKRERERESKGEGRREKPQKSTKNEKILINFHTKNSERMNESNEKCKHNCSS